MSDTGIARISSTDAAGGAPAGGVPAAGRSRARAAGRGRHCSTDHAISMPGSPSSDRFADVPFMEDGRRQPPMPDEDELFA